MERLRRGKRDSTVRSYESLLRTHITPAIGGLPMAKLTPAALERTLAALEQHLKPASVLTIFAVLRKLLADAERLGVIQDNPLRRVQRPAARRQERPAWTGEQARSFLLAADGDPDYAMWLTLLTTGTRVGEVLALGWADVSWDAGTLTIRRTLTQNRKHAEVLGETTKGGRIRTVPAPPVLMAMLRSHRVRQAEARLAMADLWQDRGLVFCDQIGGIRHSAGVRSRLDGLIAAAGLPRLTPHGLRHTAASLLAEHAPIAVARDVLGHSSLAITDRYVHGTDAAKRAGSDTLARIVAGP